MQKPNTKISYSCSGYAHFIGLLSVVLIVIATQRRVYAGQFELLWDVGKLPFEVKIVEGMPTLKSRVSETGIVTPKTELLILKHLPEQKVEVPRNSESYIYLLIKNKGTKTYKFSVAPHSTHPGESSIGFHFECLCNGHVYTVKKGEVWYRILALKNSVNSDERLVTLKHNIFQVKK